MVSLFFCANTAAPLSASAVKQIDLNESCFLPFFCLFCRGSVLINQRLRHFHRRFALIQTQRQIRCRTGVEQQTALEFTVTAERGQAREIGLGEGEQQPSVLLLDLRNPLLAGLGTQQRDIQQRDGLRRRLTEAVDQLVKHITALLIRSDERDTAVQIDALPRIREVFGDGVFDENGLLNRRALGNIVFGDREKRLALEAILHPMVQHRMIKKIRQAGVEDVPFVFLSVPLLFETGMDALCDETWCLSVPVEEQIKRVMARDDMTRDEAIARIESQMPLDEKCRRASLVIRTNRPIEATQAELASLLRDLRRRLG